MGGYVKCRKCGSSNRETDSKCYQCRASLLAPPDPSEIPRTEITEFKTMEGRFAFYGKCVVLVVALLVCQPYFTKSKVYGVFEWAILPFHEAGHYILLWAPRTLMMAGGTIVQLGLPLGFALYFALNRKEYFSAGVPMLWFFGSMQQMAVYMKDARFLLLPLFGADPSEGHDWNYLFGKMKLLHVSVEIGNLFHGIARLGIAATLIAMTVLVWKDYQRFWGETRKPA